MQVRITEDINRDDIYKVEKDGFGYVKEADLVMDLLDDPTAVPLLSLLAYEVDGPVGHILFTNAVIEGKDVSLSLLGPLAVVRRCQGTGIGGKLFKEGLMLLSWRGIDLVFVLGHPNYYTRFGFEPAGRLGFEAPYPILEKDADAWMVKELRPGVTGTVRCCEAFDSPEHWRE